MTACEDVRTSLSAALDGERAPLDDVAVGAHLGRCPTCAGFAAELPELARRTRLSGADPVPDLRAGILAALARDRSGSPVPARRGDRSDQRRVVAALAGLVQLVVAVPTLLGAGDAGHVAHDLAASEAALSAVFLLAAWRPDRAGVLAVVATLFAAIGLVAALGAVLAGGAPWGEVTHLVPAVGAAVLWSMAPPHHGGGPRTRTATGHG